MSGPLLSLQGVGKRYASVTALQGVDLDLTTGQSLAILGPNGAGKSTLLRLMAGLAHPTGGRIEFSGGKPDRARVGYLGHATLLYPHLTAHENLVFAGRLHGVADPRRRADVLLEEEGLADVAQRRVGGFSRGMAQRLSIARARVHAPELLLLDEPFSGLDGPAGQRLSVRLAALADQGHALVLATHAIDRAALLADTALILVGGTVRRRVAGSELSEVALESAYAASLGEAQ
ncbi:MAG: ABC transporter ATP-binding protein [Myxococcota bacterium]|nr:ABC transporter ATP-binding protein [Myxococcota bacterium]